VTLRARLAVAFVAVLAGPVVMASILLAGDPVLSAVALLAGGVLAAGLAWWLAGRVTRPLDALVDAVERATRGDLTVRCRVRGRDEAGRLGIGLDRLIAETQETRLLSVTDALTGLGNLRHLRDALRLEVERASRFGRDVGVLVLDLDHFKAVNDRYGHRAGDAVLVEFARRVRGLVREVDRTFRQGGEEFVVMLPETDVAGSITVARRIRDEVRARPITVRGAGVSVPVTVSIGVAVFPRHGLTEVEVLQAADQALYVAKAAGRDTYAVALPHQRTVGLAAGPVTGGERAQCANGASSGTTSARAPHDG
jgi:diguanylate cyclase (GGDEF)-like protein